MLLFTERENNMKSAISTEKNVYVTPSTLPYLLQIACDVSTSLSLAKLIWLKIFHFLPLTSNIEGQTAWSDCSKTIGFNDFCYELKKTMHVFKKKENILFLHNSLMISSCSAIIKNISGHLWFGRFSIDDSSGLWPLKCLFLNVFCVRSWLILAETYFF